MNGECLRNIIWSVKNEETYDSRSEWMRSALRILCILCEEFRAVHLWTQKRMNQKWFEKYSLWKMKNLPFMNWEIFSVIMRMKRCSLLHTSAKHWWLILRFSWSLIDKEYSWCISDRPKFLRSKFMLECGGRTTIMRCSPSSIGTIQQPRVTEWETRYEFEMQKLVVSLGFCIQSGSYCVILL